MLLKSDIYVKSDIYDAIEFDFFNDIGTRAAIGRPGFESRRREVRDVERAEIAAFHASYLSRVPAPLAEALAPWLAPLRRLTWLRTTTWCAKWRVETAKAPAVTGSTAARSAWSAECRDAGLIAGVRARVDDYVDPATIGRIRAEWTGPDPLSFD